MARGLVGITPSAGWVDGYGALLVASSARRSSGLVGIPSRICARSQSSTTRSSCTPTGSRELWTAWCSVCSPTRNISTSAPARLRRYRSGFKGLREEDPVLEIGDLVLHSGLPNGEERSKVHSPDRPRRCYDAEKRCAFQLRRNARRKFVHSMSRYASRNTAASLLGCCRISPLGFVSFCDNFCNRLRKG